MRMIIDPLASPGIELIPLFGGGYKSAKNATSRDPGASNNQMVPKLVLRFTLEAETTFAIIEQL
jgi:hypothetical protein